MIVVYWPTKSRRITSKFGPRELSSDGFHDGIDIGAVVPGDNDDILAAQDGVVARSYYSSSYGNCIVINHGGFSTLYAHLHSRLVKAGQEVTTGDKIGLMGTTGHSTGVHLHFEVRNTDYNGSYYQSTNGKYNNAVDPELVLVNKYTWENKIREKMDSPDRWIKGFNALMDMVDGNELGDLDIFEFSKEFIMKL